MFYKHCLHKACDRFAIWLRWSKNILTNDFLAAMVQQLEIMKERLHPTDGISQAHECVSLHMSPDLGERIMLSGDRITLNTVFPEAGQVLDTRPDVSWNQGDPRNVVRFPLNGYCKLDSVEVVVACYHFVTIFFPIFYEFVTILLPFGYHYHPLTNLLPFCHFYFMPFCYLLADTPFCYCFVTRCFHFVPILLPFSRVPNCRVIDFKGRLNLPEKNHDSLSLWKSLRWVQFWCGNMVVRWMQQSGIHSGLDKEWLKRRSQWMADPQSCFLATAVLPPCEEKEDLNLAYLMFAQILQTTLKTV